MVPSKKIKVTLSKNAYCKLWNGCARDSLAIGVLFNSSLTSVNKYVRNIDHVMLFLVESALPTNSIYIHIYIIIINHSHIQSTSG